MYRFLFSSSMASQTSSSRQKQRGEATSPAKSEKGKEPAEAEQSILPFTSGQETKMVLPSSTTTEYIPSIFSTTISGTQWLAEIKPGSIKEEVYRRIGRYGLHGSPEELIGVISFFTDLATKDAFDGLRNLALSVPEIAPVSTLTEAQHQTMIIQFRQFLVKFDAIICQFGLFYDTVLMFRENMHYSLAEQFDPNRRFIQLLLTPPPPFPNTLLCRDDGTLIFDPARSFADILQDTRTTLSLSPLDEMVKLIISLTKKLDDKYEESSKRFIQFETQIQKSLKESMEWPPGYMVHRQDYKMKQLRHEVNKFLSENSKVFQRKLNQLKTKMEDGDPARWLQEVRELLRNIQTHQQNIQDQRRIQRIEVNDRLLKELEDTEKKIEATSRHVANRERANNRIACDLRRIQHQFERLTGETKQIPKILLSRGKYQRDTAISHELGTIRQQIDGLRIVRQRNARQTLYEEIVRFQTQMENDLRNQWDDIEHLTHDLDLVEQYVQSQEVDMREESINTFDLLLLSLFLISQFSLTILSLLPLLKSPAIETFQ
jgi:hypothetical protein